ncbi:MAG: peptide chain release factor-like protein, partial [Aeromonadaceae bacterium]
GYWRGFYVEDLYIFECTNVDDMLFMLTEGMRHRAVGSHNLNKDSSRSHSIFSVVVECQDERSQHKNRAKAMAVLTARLVQLEEDKRRAEEANTRRSLLSTGDRSDRIRTYNYPQGRVTDHRINLTVYRLNEVMEGDLDTLVQPILHEYQADQLAALSDIN